MVNGELLLAGHHRGVRQHVPVVGVVDQQRARRRAGDRAETTGGLDRLGVGDDRILPAPVANIDV